METWVRATVTNPPVTPPNTSVPDTVKEDRDITLALGQAGSVSLDKTNNGLHLTINKVTDTSTLVSDQETLLSSVYEVSSNLTGEVDKPATVTLSFDPSKLGKDRKASIFAYDESKKQWIEIGGVVDGNKITVEVDHFTKLAVFAVSD
ncbi:hypothetical protein [Cohnella sp. WQ 127256]|uniref:hypothetical protein n=1 Tax=Cohnella sp. WQ 127256 TaxID=2938790 RepID=UPI00211868EB|nr:hypothetical protein [Cohnella sp. WQ 127256]